MSRDILFSFFKSDFSLKATRGLNKKQRLIRGVIDTTEDQFKILILLLSIITHSAQQKNCRFSKVKTKIWGKRSEYKKMLKVN